MIIENLTSPIFANAAGSVIAVTVKFEGIPDAVVNYCVSEENTDSIGVEIYQRVIVGEAGPIADFDPTVIDVPSVIIPAPANPVPSQITMRQCRLQLLADGLLDDVDTAIAAMPSPQKEAAEIEWEYSAVVQRTSPLISGLAPALGLDDADVDQLFISAALL